MRDPEPAVLNKQQFEIDLREEGVSQVAICKMKKRRKKSMKSWRVFMGSSTKSIRNDLPKRNMIFSEESSRGIYDMGNMELIELRQTSATFQCLSCLKHVPEGLNMCQCGVLASTQSRYDGSCNDSWTREKSRSQSLAKKTIKKPWMQKEEY